uniref:Uncharacterized protein n=1 Tax=Rhizophora mucronata TaxID=61149 RepID=A0A2P2PMQ5_RHIMU
MQSQDTFHSAPTTSEDPHLDFPHRPMSVFQGL